MEGQSIGLVNRQKDLKTKLTEMLEIVVLPEMSRVNEQCIYMVPTHIRQVNPKAYTPEYVSIGPFHNPRGSEGKDTSLVLMEDIKLQYLKGFLYRTKMDVGDFVPKLQEWESKIRSCYAGPVTYDSIDFLEIILIDACFIIELFLKIYTLSYWMENDPLLSKPWMINNIRFDLLLLENQLPFFVLEDLYEFTGINTTFPSFLEITFFYFQFENEQELSHEGVRPIHFIDLLRTFMLPSSFNLETTETEETISHVYSASQLSEAGLAFQVNEESKCLLDLEFDKGILKMPYFLVHGATERCLRNILAFEECHLSHKNYIAQYLAILHFLFSTEKDVSLLMEKKILSRTNETKRVAEMIDSLTRNTTIPLLNSKYLDLCLKLNAFYENRSNKYKAILVKDYFNTPWKIASTIAAVLLLLFTLIQTICSVISVIKGK